MTIKKNLLITLTVVASLSASRLYSASVETKSPAAVVVAQLCVTLPSAEVLLDRLTKQNFGPLVQKTEAHKLVGSKTMPIMEFAQTVGDAVSRYYQQPKMRHYVLQQAFKAWDRPEMDKQTVMVSMLQDIPNGVHALKKLGLICADY